MTDEGLAIIEALLKLADVVEDATGHRPTSAVLGEVPAAALRNAFGASTEPTPDVDISLYLSGWVGHAAGIDLYARDDETVTNYLGGRRMEP